MALDLINVRFDRSKTFPQNSLPVDKTSRERSTCRQWSFLWQELNNRWKLTLNYLPLNLVFAVAPCFFFKEKKRMPKKRVLFCYTFRFTVDIRESSAIAALKLKINMGSWYWIFELSDPRILSAYHKKINNKLRLKNWMESVVFK